MNELKERPFWDVDDKTLVITAVFLICAMAMFFLENPINLLENAMAGLFGIAVGRSMK